MHRSQAARWRQGKNRISRGEALQMTQRQTGGEAEAAGTREIDRGEDARASTATKGPWTGRGE